MCGELLDEGIDEVFGNIRLQIQNPEHNRIQLEVVLLGGPSILKVNEDLVKFTEFFFVFSVHLYIQSPLHNLSFQ